MPDARPNNYNDPDRQNSEQDESGTQAQDVAKDARNAEPRDETETGETPDPADVVPRDVPDLTEKQKEMVKSGSIDMDAYAGEPKMDDTDGTDS